MAEMKDMYQIVKFTYAHDIDGLSKHKAKKLSEAVYNLGMAYADNLRWYHRKPNEAQVAKLIIAAYKDDGYLRKLGDKDSGIYLDVSRKGMHLVGKKYHLFRVGLWDESLKQYDKAQTAALLIITALVGALGGTILGFAFHAIFRYAYK